MATPKHYDADYKVQAVKLAKEIGGAKAAKELGISRNTLYTWMKREQEGQIDLGQARSPENAMSLAEQVQKLNAANKKLEKEIKRLQEENEFLAEASTFFVASRQKYKKAKE